MEWDPVGNEPPHQPTRRRLDEILQELQFRQAQHDERSATIRYTYRLPAAQTPPSNPLQGFGTLSDVERREFLRRMAAAGGLGFIPSERVARPITSALMGALQPVPVFREPGPAPWAEAIRGAVVWPATIGAGGGVRPMDDLRSAVDLAFRLDLASRRSALANTLPVLIADAENLAAQVDELSRRRALGLLADVYGIACWTLIKADDANVAWVAAERSLDAARRADDPIRVATAMRCLSEAHMRAGRFDVASRMATNAPLRIDQVPASDRTLALSVQGAAYLSAAASAARALDRVAADEALAAAGACADHLGEDRTDLGIVFGPTNVAIHSVVVAIELGDAAAARRAAGQVDLSSLPEWLGERRSRFLIDLARAHAQLGDDADAMQTLLRAERVEAEEARSHRLTHGLVRMMLGRERRSATPELRAFAARCGLLAS